ncbi:MAG: hypothetical protein PHO64_09240 [Thiomonas sp.]|nr:hypothetical protein [Thiomonas sp.]
MLAIQQERGQFEVEVLALGLQRLSAALAQTRYRETERSRVERARLSALHRWRPEPQAVRQGRPSKLERRQLLRLRDTLPD